MAALCPRPVNPVPTSMIRAPHRQLLGRVVKCADQKIALKFLNWLLALIISATFPFAIHQLPASMLTAAIQIAGAPDATTRSLNLKYIFVNKAYQALSQHFQCSSVDTTKRFSKPPKLRQKLCFFKFKNWGTLAVETLSCTN